MKELFDQAYVENYPKDLSRIKRLLKFVSLSKEAHVADFGCGDGKLAHLISDRVSSYVGIDFSEQFIAKAKKDNAGIKNAVFICGDIADHCNSNPGRYDAAFALDTAEYVTDPEFCTMFSAIKISIKKGGRLYIHNPNSDFIIDILKKRNVIKPTFSGSLIGRGSKEFNLLLRSCGFKIKEEIRLSHYIGFLKVLHLFSYIPFIGKYFTARILFICEA